MIIVNTDPSAKSSKHWILLYFDARGCAKIFDSLGNESYHSSIKKFIQRHSTHYMHAVHEFSPKALHSVDIIVSIMLILDVRGCLRKKIVHTMPSPQWIKIMYSHSI